jgi:hypothetical protein
MILGCSWCGSWAGVKPVKVNGALQPSPIEGVPLHLCYRCWGVYRDTGQRYGMVPRPPDPGPITGVPLTPALLRGLR